MNQNETQMYNFYNYTTTHTNAILNTAVIQIVNEMDYKLSILDSTTV